MNPDKNSAQNDSPHFTPEDRRICTLFEAVSMSLLNVLVFAFLLAGRKFLVVLAMFWPALAGAAVLLAASVFLAHRRNNG
ncbi:hypothetical protein DZK27_14010 [Rhodobacteraceae bacterium 63075]|nr:hypothetical protein DZK27_14010 [Rhodobacteraceae bacterium 63075]